jgi:hypothetical protein
MTSRNPDCKKYSTVKAEELEGLDHEHSIELLLKAAEIEERSWSSQSGHAQVVVDLLGSHP